MTIELSASVEEELRALAVTQRRDMGEILEEAVHLYIEAAAITDLDAAEVAEAQVALVSELRGVEEWKDGRE
jgi:predicted transcriptional regulator